MEVYDEEKKETYIRQKNLSFYQVQERGGSQGLWKTWNVILVWGFV